MHDNDYNSSNSGYLLDAFEGISTVFTDFEKIHSSASNTVYRAKRYGKWWLIKTLNPGLSENSLYCQRLRKETEILMSLQHEDIVAAIGFEDIPELGKSIVMEFVDGVTLDKWLDTKPDRSSRTRAAYKLVDALSYIHSKGIVHRDLKPANILVAHNGESIKIIDFGLADTVSHTILKQPAGTPAYMSDEQKQSSVPDIRNDIYSLGIIFKTLLPERKHVIKKCLLPIESRFRNTGELKKALERNNTLRQRYPVLAFLILTFVIILLFGMGGLREGNQNTSQAVSMNTVKNADKNDLPLTDTTETVIRHDETSLHKSSEESKIILAPDNKVDLAIERGIEQLHETWSENEYVRHIDTLKNMKYFRTDISFDLSPSLICIDKYIQSLDPSFSNEQKNLILDRLNQENRVLAEKLLTKSNQLVNEQK